MRSAAYSEVETATQHSLPLLARPAQHANAQACARNRSGQIHSGERQNMRQSLKSSVLLLGLL